METLKVKTNSLMLRTQTSFLVEGNLNPVAPMPGAGGFASSAFSLNHFEIVAGTKCMYINA